MMMRKFLIENKLTQREAAAILGISRPHLSQVVSGSKRPSLDLAVRIERLTDGAVPVSSWVDDSDSASEAA